MAFLDTLEKGLLFRISRIVTLFLIVALAVAIVLTGFVAYKRIAVDTYVVPDDVTNPSRERAEDGHNAGQSASESRSSLRLYPSLPPNIKKYFDEPTCILILEPELVNLAQWERREYLTNLSDVIASAESHNVDVQKSMLKYIDMKRARLQNRPSHAERTMISVYAIGTIFGLVLLIAVFSLVLVLLAIERNTRNALPVTAT